MILIVSFGFLRDLRTDGRFQPFAGVGYAERVDLYELSSGEMLGLPALLSMILWADQLELCA